MDHVKVIGKPVVGLTVMLTVVIWILISVLIGSNYLNETRINHLHVIVVDLDQGMVGQQLAAMAQRMNGVNVGSYPTFDVKTDLDFEEARREVLMGNYWGAVVAMPNATGRLNAGLADPTVPYDPTKAMTVIYDEGRNPSVVPGRVAGPVKSILGSFATQFSAILINQLLTRGTPMARYLNHTSILSAPVYYSEQNLHPPSSIGFYATTLVLILEAVIALASVMALNGLITSAKLHEHLRTANLLLLYAALLLVLPLLFSISIAGVIAAFHGLVDVTMFGAYWLWCYLLMLVLMWNLQVILVAVGDKAIGVVFFFYMVLNITGGFGNVDIEHPFYAWSVATPFYHAISGARGLLFGVEVNWVEHSLSLVAMLLSSWILLPVLVMVFKGKKLGLWSEAAPPASNQQI